MEQVNQKKTTSIDIGQIVGALFRQVWVILCAGVWVGLLAMLYTKATTVPMYVSSTKIYVQSGEQESASSTGSDYQLSSLLAQDYSQMIAGRTVVEKVILELGLHMSAEDLASEISVKMGERSSRMIVISVSDSDPYMAQRIAIAVRDTAAVQIQEVMNTGEISVVEEANIPQAQLNKSLRRNGIGGILAGMVLACGVVMLLYLANDTIKKTEDVEQYLGISVLGVIPVIEEKKRKGGKKWQK